MRAAGHAPLEGIDELADTLAHFGTSVTALVKGREDGYDVHFLRDRHPHITMAATLPASGDMLLELHADELASLLTDVIARMRAGDRVHSDPRTVLLAHDKRLLGVLRDTRVTSRYLDDADVQRLHAHIIPTGTPSDTSDVRRHPQRWVSKRAVAGKGAGMHFGATSSAWKQVLRTPDTVLQPVIDQAEHDLFDPLRERTRQGVIAGTLPIIDGVCFGPGLARLYEQHPHRWLAVAQPMLAGAS